MFSVLPVLYGKEYSTGLELYNLTTAPTTANYAAQGVIALLALGMNVVCLTVIIKRAILLKRNPYKNEIFVGTRDFEEAMARAE